MATRTQNWVFLGDSLTEGVGSNRLSYVTEIAALLREEESRRPESQRRSIHEFRLRRVDPDRFSKFVCFNTAGFLHGDRVGTDGALWLWNLASEGTTVERDLEWLPLLENLRPERIFIHRGALESIVRPAALRNGMWPWWVPASWRSYAAMDPRCYFSTSRLRHLKQRSVDKLKQRTRLYLLAKQEPTPLLSPEEIYEHLSRFLTRTSGIEAEVCIIGLFKVGDTTFPGSARQFDSVNRTLERLATEAGATFLDPSSHPGWEIDDPELFYLDRFHPNSLGAKKIASLIFNALIRAEIDLRPNTKVKNAAVKVADGEQLSAPAIQASGHTPR